MPSTPFVKWESETIGGSCRHDPQDNDQQLDPHFDVHRASMLLRVSTSSMTRRGRYYAYRQLVKRTSDFSCREGFAAENA
jgi:hypothetical protein